MRSHYFHISSCSHYAHSLFTLCSHYAHSLFTKLLCFLENVKYGILISPKGPDNCQDQFPEGFAKNGRRINSKLNVLCLFVTSDFLEIQDFMSILFKMSKTCRLSRRFCEKEKSAKPIRTFSKVSMLHTSFFGKCNCLPFYEMNNF
jgi:hypothetical protein